jgi:peptidoglycan hydrolase-like protein with peptidoglycan-binding domain
VHSGQVLAEVAGRPLFVLLGAVPAYRDLRPGSEGTDVGQLQAALRDLGFADSDRAGYFGPKTKTAVVKFYSSIGFAAATTGGDDARAVRAAASALASARRDLDDAQRALATAKAAGDPTAIAAAQRAVDDANAAVTQARQEHDELVATTGPMVPLSELAFVAAMPARIDKLSATVGAAVTAPMIVISSGQLIVQASVTPADHELIKTGMAVVVTSELLGLTAEGTVDSVGELTTDSNGRSTYPVVVMPSTALDPRLAAQDVRVSVETARTAAEVLVVPLAAVSTNAVGVTTVSKWHTDGLVSAVEVRAGLSGGGFVEVTPVGGGSLQAGDQVVVGK